MDYEIHFAVELPFWLALPATEFTVVVDGTAHRVKTSNEVVRIDVGDFYRRPAGYLVKCVVESDLAATTRQLEAEYPDLPVFQRKAKTVVTHIRGVSVPDDVTLKATYDAHSEQWIEECLVVVNRLIDWYTIAGSGLKRRQEVANVSKWELASAVVSFWNVSNGMTQVGGTIQPLRESGSSPPDPISEKDLERFKEGLAGGEQPPVVVLLLFAASSLIPRGGYRNVVVDAVTALELAVEQLVQRLTREKRLPARVADYLLDRSRFEERCKRLLPALGGPSLASNSGKLWRDIKAAREKRNAILHRGDTATLSDALDALSTCTGAVAKLAHTP